MACLSSSAARSSGERAHARWYASSDGPRLVGREKGRWAGASCRSAAARHRRLPPREQHRRQAGGGQAAGEGGQPPPSETSGRRRASPAATRRRKAGETSCGRKADSSASSGSSGSFMGSAPRPTGHAAWPGRSDSGTRRCSAEIPSASAIWGNDRPPQIFITSTSRWASGRPRRTASTATRRSSCSGRAGEAGLGLRPGRDLLPPGPPPPVALPVQRATPARRCRGTPPGRPPGAATARSGRTPPARRPRHRRGSPPAAGEEDQRRAVPFEPGRPFLGVARHSPPPPPQGRVLSHQ